MSSEWLVFVSWTPHARASGLARSLRGAVYSPCPFARRWWWPLRYLVQSIATFVHLVRTAPRVVLFTNPPFVAGIPILLAARLRGMEVWSDLHSGVFDDPLWTRFDRLNWRVLRACRGVVVTNSAHARRMDARGIRAVIVTTPALRRLQRVRTEDDAIVVTAGYMFDEPLDELLEAAKHAPEVRLLFTGRAPCALRSSAPANCRFSGWLSEEDYARTLASAAGVICLTTREATMQTGGFEAVEYGLPVLISGTRMLRDFFGERGVLYVPAHDAATLAESLREFWDARRQLALEAEQAADRLVRRSWEQVSQLRLALDSSTS